MTLAASLLRHDPLLIEPRLLSAFVARCRDLSDDLKEIFGEAPQARIENGIGIVPISGILGQGLMPIEKMLGATDTADLSATLDAFARDPNVRALLLDVDSPGGTVTGIPEVAEQIASFPKPTYAFTSSEACANMSVTERNLILDDAYYSNLLGDPKVSQSFLAQLTAASLVDTKLPRLYGFDLHETTILPDNGERLVGFAAHPSAMAVAMRYLQPIAPEAYLEAGPVSDPDTGITLGYRRYYEADSGKMIAAFECLYGFTPAIAAGIKRLVAPESAPAG